MIPLLLIQVTNGAAPAFRPAWAANSNVFIGLTPPTPVKA